MKTDLVERIRRRPPGWILGDPGGREPMWSHALQRVPPEKQTFRRILAERARNKLPRRRRYRSERFNGRGRFLFDPHPLGPTTKPPPSHQPIQFYSETPVEKRNKNTKHNNNTLTRFHRRRHRRTLRPERVKVLRPKAIYIT